VSGPLEEGRLTAYLLGRLSPDEEEGIELEYLRGGEEYERLLAAEDDLIDAYAAGRLSADDARRFEERFLASPERRERVAFAKALRAHAAAGRDRREAPRRSPLLLPIAAALPVALAAGWLFVSQRELRTELARQREQYASQERASAEQQARIARLEEDLAHARSASGVASWRLEPGFERDTTRAAILSVPDGVAAVRLELTLGPAAPSGPFTARVETPEGRTVVALEGLRPGGGGRVEVVVPAAALTGGTYVVILEAGTPRETVETYRFRVAATR
jgi:hypothetical protein